MEKLGILILAGGGGKRFGGEKAFFEIRGKPMIQHVFERVSKLSTEILISCRAHREKLAVMFPQAKVIVDKWGERGALTGLASVLPEVRSEYVALVTCDSPKVNPHVIELLYGRVKGHDCAIPRWPNGYTEPLQAVYKTEKLRGAVRKAWKSKKMRLADVLKMLHDAVFVSTKKLKKVDPKLESFLNINAPEDISLIYLCET